MPKHSTPRPCSVEGCDLLQHAKGWCQLHYTRWKRHGDPLVRLNSATPAEMLGRVDRSGECHHLLTKAGRHYKTRPRVPTGAGRQVRAAVWLVEQRDGPIPAGMVVRHTCDDGLCVNPDHLVLGTQADNMRDMVERDRSARGTRNGHARLDEEQVRAIRADGRGPAVLGRLYGVSASTICDIRARRTWRHIP